MATHSSILANGELSMENPIDSSLAGYSPWGHKSRHDLATKPQGKTEKLSLIKSLLDRRSPGKVLNNWVLHHSLIKISLSRVS